MSAKKAKPPNTGLLLAVLCYGGVLGYALGQSIAEKQAVAKAKERRTQEQISELYAVVFSMRQAQEEANAAS